MTALVLVAFRVNVFSRAPTARDDYEETERKDRRDAELVFEFHLQSRDHCNW